MSRVTNDWQPDGVEVMDRTAELTPKQYMMDWLRRHEASNFALAFAEKHASSLDDAWQRCPNNEYVVWLATRPGVLDDRTLRKFMCFRARQVWDLLEDPRSCNAVEVAERYADGLATDQELAEASAKASEASAAAYVAYVVVSEDADKAACSSAKAVYVAAVAAAYAAYSVLAYGAYAPGSGFANATARAEQARWLREYAMPNWGQKS